jgi:hypothetical protein
MTWRRQSIAAAFIAILWTTDAFASGHGPLFGAATPTLGRGAWSVDQAWTVRFGDEVESEQMLKTMVTFGITEVLQVSGSIPELMSNNTLPAARMMSAMSNDREFEGLIGYRFQRRPVGVGGRRESTLYVGGTMPMERDRNGLKAGGSLVVGLATGYAGRAHYVWIGGGLQHYFERDDDRFGDSRTATAVYGYRPRAFREVAGRPDLRFFVETTFEDRQTNEADAIRFRPGPRTVLIGPSSLLVYKAMALEGGIQWPAYQRAGAGNKERARVAVNFSYFWFR